MPFRCVPALLRCFVLSLFLAAPVAAAAADTGTVEGRVSNPTSGLFLERVRVTLGGEAREVFTDPAGFYRLAGVPAGSARIRVFHTGFAAQ